MKISIESQVLNHYKRSGLMTYAEGLIYGVSQFDAINDYSLLYYSLRADAKSMPGPSTPNFNKVVLRVPDKDFFSRQEIIDSIILPMFFKSNKIELFHRVNGYTMPNTKGVYKILTIHDLRTLTIGDNIWKQNIKDYQSTIKNLDMCIVVSECTKQDVIKHFKIPENKIKVIYLGADKRFKPLMRQSVEKVCQKFNINEPFLFSIGSVPRKNITGIISGYSLSKATKNFKLVIGCNKDIDKYKLLAKNLNIHDRVIILPNIDDDDVVALYSGCYAFLFPSLYEGFGLPILEAMQCGAPVITSNISSCPEVAGEAALFVDPNNTEEIAESINQLCQNSFLRNDLVNKGRERTKLFTWDNYAKEIHKIYLKY